MPKTKTFIALVASTAAAGLGGAVIANAADTATATTGTTPSGQKGDRGGPGGRGPGAGETALTGDTKTKVEAAALAKVTGGTIVRSETDQGGVYEAHVKKSDGTFVVVKVDASFNVTSVDADNGGGGGRGGHGGHGAHADLAAVAKDLDVTEAKLQAAVDAARPAKTSADKPDRGTDDEKTRDAARTAQQTALYAAVAKTLGKDASAVQKAFEARQADRGPR